MTTTGTLRSRQVELLRRLQGCTPPPFLMGGFAEDALLHGTFSRDHGDIDLVVERSDLADLLRQLRAFGYDDWKTRGETASVEPFYLEKRGADGLLLEIGVTDRNGGDLFLEIARVDFTLETRAAPVGYRVHLPGDMFQQGTSSFEGIPVRCISPLANYQLRVGIASQGTFGPLRPQDRVATEALRAKFFPTADEGDLQPRVEAL